MEITLQQAGFAFLAAVIVVFSVMTVTTKRILRAATYVLFATAGIYFQLNYSFLGAVQLLIYAGGVVVLYVFSILLTSSDEEKKTPLRNRRVVAGLAASVAGAVLCIFLLVTHSFGPSQFAGGEIDMHTIGHAMMGTGKYQYLLPFEAVSVLLLACIVGGLLIARKRK